MNDATVGRAMRALRRRKGWRQQDLAAAAKVSQAAVSRAERGHVAGLSLAATRSLFAALDAGCSVSVWWRSGELDRLLDEDHAALVARAVAFLERHGWSAQVEATFQVDREAGSIDILATRRADGVALIVEVKSRLMSVEELLRTLDRKVRVAAHVVLRREGWRPTFVGRLVVFADDSTNGRRVARASLLETALPLRGHEIAAWLRAPGGTAAGLVFLSPSQQAVSKRGIVRPQRVRLPVARTKRAETTRPEARATTYQPGDD